jgi:hypothetical protein
MGQHPLQHQKAGAARSRFLFFPSMFNFSANHLLLLSRTECRSCVVFLMRDDSTRRVYRLYDFTKSQTITPYQYYCVSGKVNSADKLYLVLESVKPDTKHSHLCGALSSAGAYSTWQTRLCDQLA